MSKELLNLASIGQFSDDEKTEHRRRVPRVIHGQVITDLVNFPNVSGSLKPALSSDGQWFHHESLSKEEAAEVMLGRIRAGTPRVFIVAETELRMYRVSSGPGNLVQTIVVFPRERIEVETTTSKKVVTGEEQVTTILDSSVEETEKTFSEKVRAASGRTREKAFGWNAGGEVFGVTLGANGSDSVTETSERLNEQLRRDVAKAELTRRVELRIHREKTEETSHTSSMRRQVFNSNYDIPLNLQIYQLVEQYVVAQAVTGFKLVYQSADAEQEVRVSSLRYIEGTEEKAGTAHWRTQLSRFVEEVAIAGKKDELVTALEVNLHINDAAGKIVRPLETGFTSDIVFTSEMLGGAIRLTDLGQQDGVVVSVSEVQLPSAVGFYGTVEPGNGTALGPNATVVHEQALKAMTAHVAIAEQRAALLKEVADGLIAIEDGKDKLAWAQMAAGVLDALPDADVTGMGADE